jgi:hypothetical protein
LPDPECVAETDANGRFTMERVPSIAVHFDEKDAAISLLERNFAGGGVLNVKAAEADPDLNPLRDDPRFQAMLDGARRRLGMVPVEVATTAGSNQATS